MERALERARKRTHEKGSVSRTGRALIRYMRAILYMTYYISTKIKAKEKKENRSEEGMIEASRNDGCVDLETRRGVEMEWKRGVRYEKGSL